MPTTLVKAFEAFLRPSFIILTISSFLPALWIINKSLKVHINLIRDHRKK